MGNKQIEALVKTQHLLKKFRHSLISLMPPRFVDELSALILVLDEALDGVDHEL